MRRNDTQAEYATAYDKLDCAGEDARGPAPTGERRSVVEVFEPSRGGVPAHVGLLARGLISRGWHVTVVGSEDAPVMDQLASTGARLVRLKIAHQPHPRDILT